MTKEEFIKKEIEKQREIEKSKVFKEFRVVVYEQKKSGGYPFTDFETDNFYEAVSFAKKMMQQQKNYRPDSEYLWATMSKFTKIEERANVRYPYYEIARFGEEDLETSKYEFGGDFQSGVYAKGGSLESHGIKEGDTFLKTISGAIQKVKDKNGNIFYINLATGERDTQPPLPFDDGGSVGYEQNLKRRLKFINEDAERIFKNAPKSFLEYPVKDWDSIGTLLSNIEIASNLKDNESDDWKSIKFSGLNSTEKLERRLKFISEDAERIFKNAPKRFLEHSVKDWDSIGTLLSNIEIASNLKDNESDNWKFDDGGEVTYFLNKDGIRVRSKVEPKEKLSEAEWMAKHSESKEARGYAFGGFFGKAKETVKPSKYPKLEGKQVMLKNGKMVQVFEQYGSTITVVELGKMGSGERPHSIDISEVDMTSFATGGGVTLNTEVILSENRPNGAVWQGVVKPFMLESIEKNQYAGGFKRYEIDIYDEVKREPTKEEIKKANEFFDKIGGRYASGGKLPDTIDGYEIDFTKWRADIIASIEVEPKSAPFEPFQMRGVGKTEKEAFQNLEKEYNSMKISSYVVTFSIDDSGWIKSNPISAYTEEQASNILYESASEEGDVSILKIDKISMASGGGVGLIGNQSKIDMNKNGKIDAEDFEIMRNTMDGAWRKDRKYVNSTSRKNGKVIDYEVRYARKNKPSRKGYKGKTNYAYGGGLNEDVSVIYVDNYPYYIKKMDSTHFRMANSKDGVDIVIPSHILQHRGESYFEDVRSWLKGGANPNGKKYETNDSYATGGGVSKFEKLSNRVAKNYEGKRVKPQYQKEYGKVYSKSEAKEVGDKVAGKVKANQKMATGGETKKGAKGGIMVLAKKIRKDGESWQDALKRAGQQLK